MHVLYTVRFQTPGLEKQSFLERPTFTINNVQFCVTIVFFNVHVQRLTLEQFLFIVTPDSVPTKSDAPTLESSPSASPDPVVVPEEWWQRNLPWLEQNWDRKKIHLLVKGSHRGREKAVGADRTRIGLACNVTRFRYLSARKEAQIRSIWPHRILRISTSGPLWIPREVIDAFK